MTDHSAIKQRLNDLVFSLQDVINGLQAEQKTSEDTHEAWIDGEPDSSEEGDEAHDKWQNEEPEIINNDDEISRIRNAIDSIEDAVSHLDD